MQRLYSMFPQGWPGVGLVLLRAAIVLPWLAGPATQPFAWQWIAAGVLTLAIALGLCTSAASLLLLVSLVTTQFHRGAVSMMASCEVLQAVALILLGPGAYSLDARIFGRRSFEVTKP